MKKVHISDQETIISLKAYRELEDKSRAHDAFKLAYDELAAEQSRLIHSAERTPMELGWLECYNALTNAIVANSRTVVRDTPVAKDWATPQDRIRAERPPRDDAMDSLPF